MSRAGIALSALLAIGLAPFGCEASDDPAPPGVENTRATLRERTVITLDPDGTNVTMRARLNRGDHWDEGKAKLDVLRGYVTVQTDVDDRLAVKQLRIELGDVVLDPQTVPPEGLHFTNIVLLSESPTVCHETAWSTDDQGCYAWVDVDLLLYWAIVIGENTYSLGTQHLSTLDGQIAITSDPEGRLQLHMLLNADGTFWYWAGIADFYDLTIDARGTDLPWVL